MTAPAPSGGPLFLVHRVLIGATIALGVILIVWGAASYRRDGDASWLALGVGGAVGAVAFALYLRWFLRKTKRGEQGEIAIAFDSLDELNGLLDKLGVADR